VVIHGYLSGLSRLGQMVHFFRDVVGEKVIDKAVLSRRTNEYQHWVEAYDLEDTYVAEARLKDRQTPLSSEQARRELGLDH
jgi:hypothetical protein